MSQHLYTTIAITLVAVLGLIWLIWGLNVLRLKLRNEIPQEGSQNRAPSAYPSGDSRISGFSSVSGFNPTKSTTSAPPSPVNKQGAKPPAPPSDKTPSPPGVSTIEDD